MTNIVLKLTNRCNLACRYCYAAKGAAKGASRLISDLADSQNIATEKVIEAAVKVVEDKCLTSFTIVLFGGEPLLEPARIKEVINRFSVFPGARYTLNTNGTMISQETAELLASNRVKVSVSLDGTARSNDRYRVDHDGCSTHGIVVNNIEYLSGYGIDVACRLTITPENAVSLVEDLRYIKSLGVSHAGIAPAVNLDWKPDQIAVFGLAMHETAGRYSSDLSIPKIFDFERIAENKAANCKPGVDVISIEPDGSISGCHRHFGPKKALIDEQVICRECKAREFCTRCTPKMGEKRPGTACNIKLALIPAYEMLQNAFNRRRTDMDRHVVINGKLYKVPQEVLDKYTVSGKDAKELLIKSGMKTVDRAEPPLKGNWYELGESECF